MIVMRDDEWGPADTSIHGDFVSAAGYSTVGERRIPRHPSKCMAEKNTCNGWKVKGLDYCFGHANSYGIPLPGKDDE